MGITKLHDRWGELNDLFHEAMSLTPTEAATLCEKIAQDDPELADFLRDLISSATEGDNELRESIEQVARDVASSDSLIGERVGAYQVEELIGRGGMGEVYLASRADGEFDKKVAIKVVRKRLAAADYLPVSRNERQALATLDHPGVPALVDSGQLDDGRSYFICDYVEGEPLQQYCAARGLPLRERLDLFCDVARALTHAHNRLVLHLDIKPDNILVKKDGRPSLLDFGVARLLNDSDDRHLAFSPGYASPEQIRNENVDVTSDVFSMGALLYFLLTSKAPFDSPRYAQSHTIIEVRSSEASAHRQRASLAELDADLEAIVTRAMAETPADRYDSVSALMQDVQHYLEHRPVVARNGGPAYQSRKFLRRNWLPVSAVALLLGASVIVGVREASLRQQAAQEAAVANQIAGFMEDVFVLSDPLQTRDGEVTAREVLDNAATQLADNQTLEPAVAIRLLNSIGKAQNELELFGESLATLERGLAIFHTSELPEGAAVSDLYLNLSKAYRDTSDFERSIEYAQRGLALRQQLLGERAPEVGDAYGVLGRAAGYGGNMPQAADAFETQIAVYDATLEEGDERHGLARYYFAAAVGRLGHKERSLELMIEAKKRLERVWGSDHPKLYYVLESLALAYGELRQDAEAERLYREVLSIRQAVTDSDDPILEVPYMNLGFVSARTGKLDEAEALITRSIALGLAAHGPTHFRLCVSRYNLSELYLRQGRLDDSRREADLAYSICEQSFGPANVHTANSLWRLAAVQAAQGELEVAEKHYRKAHAYYADYPEDDWERQDLEKEMSALIIKKGSEYISN